MDTKINVKDFLSYAKEVCLQEFRLIANVIQDLTNKGDIIGLEKIQKEVIPVYEGIYLSLDEKDIEEIKKENEKLYLSNKKFIEDLAKESDFSDEYILSQIKKREELKGRSGAEVVERLFNYEIKELKKIKGDLLSKLNKLLDEEEKLNLELSNAIQEVEQLEIIDKINPIRREYRENAELLENYQKRLDLLEDKLSKKWYYEIYGTIEEKVLLDTYNSVYKTDIK